MATYLEIRAIKEQYELTDEDMDEMIEVVCENNWKARALVNSVNHWSELYPEQISMIIDAYPDYAS